MTTEISESEIHAYLSELFKICKDLRPTQFYDVRLGVIKICSSQIWKYFLLFDIADLVAGPQKNTFFVAPLIKFNVMYVPIKWELLIGWSDF